MAYEGIATTKERAIARRSRLLNVAVDARSPLRMTADICDMAFTIPWAFIKGFCDLV